MKHLITGSEKSFNKKNHSLKRGGEYTKNIAYSLLLVLMMHTMSCGSDDNKNEGGKRQILRESLQKKYTDNPLFPFIKNTFVLSAGNSDFISSTDLSAALADNEEDDIHTRLIKIYLRENISTFAAAGSFQDSVKGYVINPAIHFTRDSLLQTSHSYFASKHPDALPVLLETHRLYDTLDHFKDNENQTVGYGNVLFESGLGVDLKFSATKTVINAGKVYAIGPSLLGTTWYFSTDANKTVSLETYELDINTKQPKGEPIEKKQLSIDEAITVLTAWNKECLEVIATEQKEKDNLEKRANEYVELRQNVIDLSGKVSEAEGDEGKILREINNSTIKRLDKNKKAVTVFEEITNIQNIDITELGKLDSAFKITKYPYIFSKDPDNKDDNGSWEEGENEMASFTMSFDQGMKVISGYKNELRSTLQGYEKFRTQSTDEFKREVGVQ